MRFGHIFTAINIVIDHQAVGLVIKYPEINCNARTNLLGSQMASGPNEVVYPVANEQLERKMEYLKCLKAHVYKEFGPAPDFDAISEIHHRSLQQKFDSKLTAVPPMQQVQPAQVPTTNPINSESQESLDKRWPWRSQLIAVLISANIAMGVYTARIIAKLVRARRQARVAPEAAQHQEMVTPQP